MPVVYRLCKKEFAPSTPDKARAAGKGAAYGRSHWNCKGTEAVYTSSSIALAVLEIMVNLTPPVFPNYECWRVEVPDSTVLTIQPEALPVEWRDRPYRPSVQALGDSWLVRSSVVAVPSAVLPQERNYLLNPHHSSYPVTSWERVKDFDFDPRLVRLVAATSPAQDSPLIP